MSNLDEQIYETVFDHESGVLSNSAACAKIRSLIKEARIDELNRITDNEQTFVVSDIQDVKERIEQLKESEG